MRSQSCFCLVSVVVAGVVLGGVAGAQSSEPACSMGFTSALAYGLSAKSGPVFSATAKTRFEQRLPDGSYIRAYARTHEARDAAGRAMSEAPRGCRRDENGVPQPEMVVSVFDPATKSSLIWQVGVNTDKVVRVLHQPETPAKAPDARRNCRAQKGRSNPTAVTERVQDGGSRNADHCWRGSSRNADHEDDSSGRSGE